MASDNRFAAVYLQEAEEHLEVIEDAVLALEENTEDTEAIDRLFRSMHTIKGSGAMFGFEDVSSFTHHVESALDDVRAGRLSVSKELIDLVLRAKDQIQSMLQASVGNDSVDLVEAGQIIGALERLTGKGRPQSEVEPAGEVKRGPSVYQIVFKPHPGVMKTGLDPACLVDELSGMGDCLVTLHTQEIPDWHSFDPESCYLSWEFHLLTTHDENEIRDVFIFVEGESEVTITHLEEIQLDDQVPKIGEILVQKGYLTKNDVDTVLSSQKKVGEVLVASGKVSEDSAGRSSERTKGFERAEKAERDQQCPSAF